MNLRKAIFSDLPMLGQIRSAAIMAQPETFWTHEEKEKAAAAWTGMEVQRSFPDYNIYIYQHAEKDSGFIGWKDSYLGYLFLLPELQNSGTGSKLLKFAENEIRKSHDHIWLFAHPYSEKFYESHGFKKKAETENPFGTTLLHKFYKSF